jgi:hypothetical protein
MLRAFPFGHGRKAIKIEASEAFNPWYIKCSCGFGQRIKFLDAVLAVRDHKRRHWINALMEWNLG